jgi:starch phosphorylase
LQQILNNAEMPVQIIFAGKAHPHDTAGKELIRQIVNVARKLEFRHSLVFLEDYDMNVARYLVQGVDVWLNTPQRPKEASGTSGMKVIYNGGLNCSILDGWWAEGYNPSVGWAIGNGEEYAESDWEHQNYIESEALYNLLERDILPLFYERGRDGLPRQWIAKMKTGMKTLGPFFNTRRMVQEYTEQFYMPDYELTLDMTTPDLNNGVAYAAWRKNLESGWSEVQVRDVIVPEKQVSVGTDMDIQAVVYLGKLTPDDVQVQLYYGPLSTRGEIGSGGKALNMEPVDNKGNGLYTFSGHLAYRTSGARGLSVRVVPHHSYLTTSFQPGMIAWAKP